jgi:hypothetical protein
MIQRITPPQRLGRLRWPVLALFTALVLLSLASRSRRRCTG